MTVSTTGRTQRHAWTYEPARVHGGPDARGAAAHDFSTNSNACGPCPEAAAAVRAADAAHYPDPLYTDLRERLASWHRVPARRVLLAGSASEFIYRLTAWVVQQGGRRVWLPRHGYGDYAEAAHAWQLRSVALPAQAQLLWACDPSSPLGQDEPEMEAIGLGESVCVLDRAYEPLRLSGALGLPLERLNRVWQLWSPNKALGLTGVRAAYAIAPHDAEDAVQALEQLCPSWPVGAHGAALLQAWTMPGVQAWLADSLVTLRDWKLRQVALCEAMGWICRPSHANFHLARPASPQTAGALLRFLREREIKLRDTASFGLPGQFRLGVLPPASQDALAGAVRQWDATLLPAGSAGHPPAAPARPA
ncbi:aminotransferase [Rhodoferax koreense]|uniref:histidinol-phosphate transaminase n=1 Tax=Rhodoferax koreensis TaxID=1842727 RepID=A0A1P8JVD5_9BURK|nr:aminotransferase class I/II-fold pyridoxal phosphate-dependent enzyme [Rhodoferax koreense]APW37705.1 aminotransferase [Rhodoferax koreense]